MNRIPYKPGDTPPIGCILGRNTATGELEWLPLTGARFSDTPISTLTPDQEARAKRIQWALRRHDPRPLDEWLHNFRCGVDPEAELKVYEAIVAAYQEEVGKRPGLSKQERALLFRALVQASFSVSFDALLCMDPAVKALPHLRRVFDAYKGKIGTFDRPVLPIIPSPKESERKWAVVAEYKGVAILECTGDKPRTWEGQNYTTDGLTYLFKNAGDSISTMGFPSESDVKEYLDDSADLSGLLSWDEAWKLLVRNDGTGWERAPKEPGGYRWDETKGYFVPIREITDGQWRTRME